MKLLTRYRDLVDFYTSYAPAILFTSDTPSAKEKKKEARFIKIVDSFFNYTNYTILREALRRVETDFQLGCNTFIVEELLSDCGRFDAVIERLSVDIRNKVKSEPELKDFYKTDQKIGANFTPVFEALINLLSAKGSENLIPADVAKMKKMYYDAYKAEKIDLKETWK